MASGGHSPRAREDPRVGRERGRERRRSAAGADQRTRASPDPREDLLVGVEAEHAAVAEDERVDGVAVGLVARGDDRLLVRDRHVRAGEAELAQRCDAATASSTSNARVVPVEAAGGEGGVLHPRRERVRDRMPEQADVGGHQP